MADDGKSSASVTPGSGLAVPAARESLPYRLFASYGWNAAVLLEIIILLVVWEILVGGLHLWSKDFFPPPSAIAIAFGEMLGNGLLAKNFSFSAQNFVAGYLLAVGVGLALGLTLGSSRLLDSIFGPFVWTVYAVPRIAIQPLLVLWLGFGAAPKVLVIFLMAVFPILINAMDGVRTVNPSLVRAGKVFGASRVDLYTKVVLPATLPFVLTGLRLGIARGLVGVVVGEFIGGTAGLGIMIQRASSAFDMASAFVVTILLVLMANVSMLLLQALKQRLAPWDEEQAGV